MPRLVLIADDSGAVCGEAVNGTEAVEKAKTLKPDPVLVNLAMPEICAEAASVLKKTMPEITIIMFTMYGEDIGRYLTSVVGVDSVLSKPDGMTALSDAIDAALAKSSERHSQKSWRCSNAQDA